MNNIPNKEYRKMTGISRSELWTLISKSPAHFIYEQKNPKEDTPSLLLGRAAHKLILEPETFRDEFAVAPCVDKRTTAGRVAWAEFCEGAGGKEILTEDQYHIIKDMAVAIRMNPIASEWLQGEHEQSFFWTDPETGVPLKCRPDCIHIDKNGKKWLVDYKTTDSCAGMSFEHSCKKYGYGFQSGFYTEGLFQSTMEDYGFAFVAQEKAAPYACRVYACSPEFIREGFELFREALYIYKDCTESGEWPGYEGINGEYDVTVLEGETR